MKKRQLVQNSYQNKDKDNSNMEKIDGFHLRKADWILAFSIVTIALVFYVVINYVVKKNGETVVVKVDGQVKYELTLEHNTELTVEGFQGGFNHVIIKDKSVSMTDADCPDKICVHTGKISKTGETIVCLPHRVVVEINGDQNQVDSVVR